MKLLLPTLPDFYFKICNSLGSIDRGTGSPVDFCSCWAANNLKDPWNLFPCPKYVWAFNFPGIIETCCSDRDFWFHIGKSYCSKNL